MSDHHSASDGSLSDEDNRYGVCVIMLKLLCDVARTKEIVCSRVLYVAEININDVLTYMYYLLISDGFISILMFLSKIAIFNIVILCSNSKVNSISI